MPVTEAAKDVIRNLGMEEISRAAKECLEKWLLVKTDFCINKEDKISFLILRQDPDGRYSYFGYIGWCGQLGYTLHAARLNGIPINDLDDIMQKIEDLE